MELSRPDRVRLVWELRKELTMEEKYFEYYQCIECGITLTDESAFFDVESDDDPYCAECYYDFPCGPFFGEYDKSYDEHNPTEKQQFCISCQECCKGCWYLAPGKGCSIYPYRPKYCRGYECYKLKAGVKEGAKYALDSCQ